MSALRNRRSSFGRYATQLGKPVASTGRADWKGWLPDFEFVKRSYDEVMNI